MTNEEKAESMSRYLLHGKLSATPGNTQKLTDVLMQASRMMSIAKGCNLYAISKDQADANSVWITEIWDSKEDHDNSLKSEKVRELISKAMPLLDGVPQKGQELEILS